MIKNKIRAVKDRMEDSVKSLLGQVSPDGRIVIILTILFLFGIGSVYMTVSSIYNMGKKSGQQIQIEHLVPIEHLPNQQQADSTNH